MDEQIAYTWKQVKQAIEALGMYIQSDPHGYYPLDIYEDGSTTPFMSLAFNHDYEYDFIELELYRMRLCLFTAFLYTETDTINNTSRSYWEYGKTDPYRRHEATWSTPINMVINTLEQIFRDWNLGKVFDEMEQDQ